VFWADFHGEEVLDKAEEVFGRTDMVSMLKQADLGMAVADLICPDLRVGVLKVSVFLISCSRFNMTIDRWLPSF
jgi:hypothetical protein